MINKKVNNIISNSYLTNYKTKDYSDCPIQTEEQLKAFKPKYQEGNLGSIEPRLRIPDARLYKPIKKTVQIRLDADVLEWLKQAGSGYQTRANAILREAMLQEN